MQNVTDRTSNPFGMAPDCDRPVFGYGDANADFHVVGDHPGRHGGTDTGVPFTGSTAGRRLQSVLHEVGLLASPYSDAPEPTNCFLSYRYLCVPDGDAPTGAEYADHERFFDAELRAIAAHVLLPVGAETIEHVLRTYSARSPDSVDDLETLHATEIHGSGFLIVPIADPSTWDRDAERALIERFEAILGRDYRQTSDLGRFLASKDPYLVR